MDYLHTPEELTDRELWHIARFWLSKETKETMLVRFLGDFEKYSPGNTCSICRDAYEKLTALYRSEEPGQKGGEMDEAR
jgi:hypothetical protein